MSLQIDLGGIVLDVIKKDIRNIHLSVYPPSGKVRISAPLRMKTDTVRLFAISKLGWIKEQQRKLIEQERETPRDYVDRESHYVWGKRYLLKVSEQDSAGGVWIEHRKLVLGVRPGSSKERKQALLDEWYRHQLKATAAPMIGKLESRIGVRVQRLFVQRMKTKWGSCSPLRRSPELTHLC